VEAAEPKSKDKRPLAARRNLVKKNTEDTSGKDEDAVQADGTSALEVTSKEKLKSVEEESKEKKIVITSERTRNIEKEVAKNTANFDEEVLKKEKKEDEDKKKASNAKLIERKAALLAKNPLQAYEVIRLVRLLIIVAMAALTGKRWRRYSSFLCTVILNRSPELIVANF
jgi:hypothetical protein